MLDLSSRAREKGEGRIREEGEGAREWWVVAVTAFMYQPPHPTHTYTPPAGVLVKFSTPYRLWQEVGSRALLSSSRFLAVVTSIRMCVHMYNVCPCV